MEHIKSQLEEEGAVEAAQRIITLWHEYEDHQTVESILVHDLDKLEMIIQADEYERKFPVDLQGFFDSTEHVFRSNVVQKMNLSLRQRRSQRLQADH
jgi:putative hydrolase of HD superfamily